MRTAEISRVTKETNIQVKLTLEGGKIEIKTRIGFFDHMLTALAFYAGWGLELEVEGDLHVDGHHTVEDTGIVLGQALKQALGEKTGIRRFGAAFVPMDEALCFTALDFSNRPFLVFDAGDAPGDDRWLRLLFDGRVYACLSDERWADTAPEVPLRVQCPPYHRRAVQVLGTGRQRGHQSGRGSGGVH